MTKRERTTTDQSAAPDEMRWDDFRQSRIKVLRLVATKAEVVAKYHLSSDNFRRLIKEAYDWNVISMAELAEFGRKDPTTASRWINGHSTPDPFVQEAILNRIVQVAEEEAQQLATRPQVSSRNRRAGR